MSEKVVAEQKKQEGQTPPRGRARSPAPGAGSPAKRPEGKPHRPAPYPYELRRRAVQLYVEEGLTSQLVAQELGISVKTVRAWARRYRRYGEQGLKGNAPGGGGAKLPGAVHAKITQLKNEDPGQGVRRISQILRRVFFLKASPETVRQHLKTAGLATPKPKAHKKPHPPARRFERSTPNQMWQSDITYFPILGKTAYIIGFLDDYSRYVTGLGVYRSQPSAYVVEIYREAVATYGAPREMLTDNGRQYASWRGTTKFQQELKRDHVHHIRSTPHHPMTLGKIERFWQTLKDEFLSRARFETFEEARERIAYWVKHYNHRRPHQGLEGLCPADRFFSIHKELRATIERGVAANVEELALRGKPLEPFYLVGRMGDQSVVIETDKKRMSVRVDGRAMEGREPLVYELKEEDSHEAGRSSRSAGPQADNPGVQRQGESTGGAGAVEREAQPLGADQGAQRAVGGDQRVGEAGAVGDAHGVGPDLATGRGRSAEPAPAGGETDRTDLEAGSGGRTGGSELKQEGRRHEDSGSGSVWSGGEMPGGAGGMDGAQAGLGAVPGNGHERVAVLTVAGPGAVGYAGGTGAAGNEGGVGGPGAVAAGQAAARPQGAGAGAGEPGPERELASADGAQQGAYAHTPEHRGLLSGEVSGVERAGGSESAQPTAGDPGRVGRAPERHAGGAATGGQPQDLLPVAGPGAGGDAVGPAGPARWPASAVGRSREPPAPGEGGGAGERAMGPGRTPADTAGDPGHMGCVAAGVAAV
jgi:transposase InsO family protein